MSSLQKRTSQMSPSEPPIARIFRVAPPHVCRAGVTAGSKHGTSLPAARRRQVGRNPIWESIGGAQDKPCSAQSKSVGGNRSSVPYVKGGAAWAEFDHDITTGAATIGAGVMGPPYAV